MAGKFDVGRLPKILLQAEYLTSLLDGIFASKPLAEMRVSLQTSWKIRWRTAEMRRPDARYYPYCPSLMRRYDDDDDDDDVDVDGMHTRCIMHDCEWSLESQ
ncbi:hypothetical protein DBV15_09432, partial [Temnothorax longispinosus]